MSLALITAGTVFMLAAAIGVARFPDLFTRMHCSTKSATLGVSCIMLGAAVHFSTLATLAKAATTIVFLMITAPVGAHVLARAAYFAGVPLWKGTLSDELRDKYGREQQEERPSDPEQDDAWVPPAT